MIKTILTNLFDSTSLTLILATTGPLAVTGALMTYYAATFSH